MAAKVLILEAPDADYQPVYLETTVGSTLLALTKLLAVLTYFRKSVAG
jgi:hypothetical protein